MGRKGKIHYAWFVCIGCSLLTFCSSGLGVNAFTVYQPYILSLNGLTNAQSSLIIMFRNLFSMLALLYVRAYYRRFSMRTGMAIAGSLLVLAFVLFALSSDIVMYCISASVLGFGFGLGYTVPVAIVIEHWFLEERNTALGICSAATGLATLGIPSLISGIIERYGLRSAFLIEAAFVAVLVLASFILIRSTPGDKGVSPFGAVTESSGDGGHCVGLNRSDWFILVPVLLLIGGVMSVAYSHLTVLMSGEGYPSGTVALAVSVSGISMILGKIIYGRLCDRIGVYRCNFCFIPILLLGLALCCCIRSGTVILYAATVLFSFGISYLSVGLSSWVPELASAGEYDRTIQRFQIIYALGSLLFSPLPGIIADSHSGSYTPSFILFLILAVIVVTAVQLCIFRVAKRRLAART